MRTPRTTGICRALRYTNAKREVANPYGCVAIHARLNLLFGRKRGNLAPRPRRAMGVRAIKKRPPPPTGARAEAHPVAVTTGRVLYD